MPELCPVCKGNGVVLEDDCYQLGQYRTSALNIIDCHGCNGKGWVEVGPKYGPSYDVADLYEDLECEGKG